MLRPCSGLLALLLAFTAQAQKKEGSPEAVAAGLYARVQQLRSDPMQDVTMSSQVADLLGSALYQVLLEQDAQWRILAIRWSGGSSLVRRLREFSAYRCVP